ncbi:hypothetical protein T5B8_12613 [Salinisphaera sp. T5B8]|uniref:lysozyme inhibitor LprI family protein n=1 Tax=Salinisphaera sp. T5B8 TaxID=1304154 RepID=UPI003341AE45
MKYLAMLLLCVAASAGAITNPDAPAYVDDFQARMAAYDARLANASTTRAMNQASTDMAQALDDELNTAYKQLMTRLTPAQQAGLRASQRRWLAFLDAEFEFLNRLFTRESHGTSAALDVGQARNALVRARARTLWSYLEQR